MPTKKPTSAPLAHYAEKSITPVMAEYVAWLKQQTGYDVDPLSVQLSGVLRPAFQKATSAKRRAKEKTAPATPRARKVQSK